MPKVAKSDKVRLLEIEYERDIADVLSRFLSEHRGSSMLAMKVGLDLGVTPPTVYKWCRDYGVDFDSYKE